MAKKTKSKKVSPEKKNGSGSPLSEVKGFYEFMVEQRLETLEYDHQGLHVRLVRQKAATVPVPMAVPVSMAAPAHAISHSAPAPAPPSVPAGGLAIKSPMMGIFYRANSPSSPPFVKAGDTVKKGHVLCLIEAMKVFNEVKADYDCTVLNVLLDNGRPVKAGQDLFIVERK